MRPTVLVGMILIAVGLVALAYEGITYTTSKTVIDVGPVEARVEEKKRIPLPPILGVVTIASGLVLVFAGAKRSSPAWKTPREKRRG